MSNIQRAENLKQIVHQSATDFNKLAKLHGAVHFEREASFAIQILQENDYLAGIAMSNPDSLRRAVLNVAAVGLSLSPVHKLAYLVPRKKKVCLDISYRGRVHLAIECGAILWAKAELVYEKDTFTYMGPNELPTHKFEPFKDRGVGVGAYCVAKLPSGDFMTELMSLEEIHRIRDRSEAWNAKDGPTGPWKTDPEEMVKKTVVIRAAKSWPNTVRSDRFTVAQAVGNEIDDTVFETTALPAKNDARDERLLAIRAVLKFLGKEEVKYLEYVARVVNREIKALEDLTDIELEQQSAFVDQLADKKREVDNAAS